MHRESSSDRPDNALPLGDDLDAFDPEFVRRQLPRLGRLFGPGRWFDVQADGFENLPDGGTLIVSNHSGGTLALDVWGLMWAWSDHFGSQVPLHGLAHQLVFTVGAVGSYLAKAGAVRASPEHARGLLVDRDRYVVVMPGGDRDVWRASPKRDKVCFAGRTGYAKLAIKLGVPIVPLASVGMHDTFWVFTDGHWISKRFPIIRRLARADIFPISLSFPWGLAVGPWPHLPPPTLIQYRFGQPLHPPAGPPTPETIAAFDAQVQQAVQVLIEQLRAERPPRRQHLVSRAKALRARLRTAWRTHR